MVAESEPKELQETQEPIPIEDGNNHQETSMEPVPAEGVGVGQQQSAKLAEPPPTCDNAGSTSHSEGVPTPPSCQEPVNWIGRLRDRSSRKRPSRFKD